MARVNIPGLLDPGLSATTGASLGLTDALKYMDQREMAEKQFQRQMAAQQLAGGIKQQRLSLDKEKAQALDAHRKGLLDVAETNSVLNYYNTIERAGIASAEPSLPQDYFSGIDPLLQGALSKMLGTQAKAPPSTAPATVPQRAKLQAARTAAGKPEKQYGTPEYWADLTEKGLRFAPTAQKPMLFAGMPAQESDLEARKVWFMAESAKARSKDFAVSMSNTEREVALARQDPDRRTAAIQVYTRWAQDPDNEKRLRGQWALKALSLQ